MAQNIPMDQANGDWLIPRGSYSRSGVQNMKGSIRYPVLKWDYVNIEGAEGYPVIGDIDGDGDMEVVVSNLDRHLRVLDATTGNLVYEKRLSYTNPIGMSTIISDVDQDQEQELIITSDSLLWCLDAATGAVEWTRYISPYYFITVAGPLVGDLDGNGSQEIIINTQQQHVHAFEGASGNFVGQFLW